MKVPAGARWAASRAKLDTGIIADECPSGALCRHYRTTEDACDFCRLCFTIFNAHLEPNSYAGRGRA